MAAKAHVAVSRSVAAATRYSPIAIRRTALNPRLIASRIARIALNVGKPCVHHDATPWPRKTRLQRSTGIRRPARAARLSWALILGRASAAIEIVVLEIGDQGCRGTNSVSCHDIKNPAPVGCFRWAHGASLRIYVIVRSWNTTTLLVKNGCPRLDQTRKSRRKSDSAKLPIIVERSNVIPVITRRPWGRTSPADIPPLRFSPGVAPAPSWRQNLLRPPSF